MGLNNKYTQKDSQAYFVIYIYPGIWCKKKKKELYRKKEVY